MAWISDVNFLVSVTTNDRNGSMWYHMYKLLITAGWTILGSGDGNANFENTGDTAGPFDVITIDPATGTFNSFGAGGFNSEGWVRLQMPGSTLEMVIKRSTGDEHQVTIAFSPTGFNNTGIANANTPPTAGATDEVFLHTTSFTTYAQTSAPINGARRIHCMAQNAAVGGVYSFWCAMTEGSTLRGGGFFTHVDDPSVGDPQPWVAIFRDGPEWTFPSSDLGQPSTAGNLGPRGYFDQGGAGEVFDHFPALRYGNVASTQVMPAALGAAPDGGFRHFPIVHATHVTGNYKGINGIARWKSSPGRNYPDTFDLAGANPRVIMGDLVLPWAQGVTPL